MSNSATIDLMANPDKDISLLKEQLEEERIKEKNQIKERRRQQQENKKNASKALRRAAVCFKKGSTKTRTRVLAKPKPVAKSSKASRHEAEQKDR